MINLEAYKSDKKEFVMDDYGHIRPANINQSELAKEVLRNEPELNQPYPTTLQVMKEAENFRNAVAQTIGYRKKFSWEK